MELQIGNLAGADLCLIQATSDQSVHNLKDSIRKVTGVPVKEQQLLCGNNVLPNNSLLKDVVTASELVMVNTLNRWHMDIAEDWRRLRKAPEGVKNDRETVMGALHQSAGQAIKYAGEEARADPQIMALAMEYDKTLFRYARAPVGRHAAFMRAARMHIEDRGGSRDDVGVLLGLGWHESPELCEDIDFMEFAVGFNAANMKHVSAQLRSNSRLGLATVNCSWRAFESLPIDLRSDREFVMRCVSLHGGIVMKYLPEQFTSDRDIVVTALQHPVIPSCFEGSALQYVSAEFKADRWLAELAIAQEPRALEHVSDELKSDPQFVMKAVQSGLLRTHAHRDFLKFASPSLLADPDFTRALFEVDAEARFFPYLASSIRTDPEFARKAHAAERARYGAYQQWFAQGHN